LLVKDTCGHWSLPAFDKTDHERIEHLPPRFCTEFGIPLQMGLLYSIYDDTRQGHQHIVYRATLGAGELQHGQLFAITHLPLAQISDNAIRETLKRYQQESQLGNFGIYFGDQAKGQVHTLGSHTNNKAGIP